MNTAILNLLLVQAQNISQTTLNNYVTTAAINAGLNTDTWIVDIQTEKNKWQSFNTLLRTYCGPNAVVTTYTYKPLVGMTSMAGANGLTTYYEYDNFGRLKILKDNDSNIVKKYDYH